MYSEATFYCTDTQCTLKSTVDTVVLLELIEWLLFIIR